MAVMGRVGPRDRPKLSWSGPANTTSCPALLLVQTGQYSAISHVLINKVLIGQQGY